MTTEEFGQYMSRLRKEQRLSLRAVSSKADVSITYICQIEGGTRKPSAEILKKLAPVYGVPIQDLLKEAGYFEKPNEDKIGSERIEAAFKLVETDKDYKFGTYMHGKELSLEAKKYIVEVYQKTTGRQLL